MEKCPVCNSTSYKNGICKKCNYKNTNPAGYSFQGLGYKQKALIEIGKNKGFVLPEDILKFYSSNQLLREINKLVALNYFENPVDTGITLLWRFKK